MLYAARSMRRLEIACSFCGHRVEVTVAQCRRILNLEAPAARRPSRLLLYPLRFDAWLPSCRLPLRPGVLGCLAFFVTFKAAGDLKGSYPTAGAYKLVRAGLGRPVGSNPTLPPLSGYPWGSETALGTCAGLLFMTAYWPGSGDKYGIVEIRNHGRKTERRGRGSHSLRGP